MFIVGPATIDDINSSIDFVATNLKHQYVIPHYACGYACDHHTSINGLTSSFYCKIVIKNANQFEHEIDVDYGEALADMAEVIVEDYLDSDCNKDGNYYETPAIYYFKIDYSKSITQTVEINGEPFEITVTYERKYTKTL